MVIRRAPRASIAASVLALFILAACGTASSRTPPVDAPITVHLGSGGYASVGAQLSVAEDGTLFYKQDRPRTARVDPEQVRAILTQLRSPAVRGYLERVEQMDYRAAHYDAPHMVFILDGEKTFIPAGLTMVEPLRSYLEPLDTLAARVLGRRYTVRLMPRPEDYDELRYLIPTRLPQP
ncbi:MAG TPA: hypothetical protein VEU30_12485 [Thermoanaerobaculia bacterium]|nr:hypothetical protein [Thermoanaerobaculia bacterium]